MSSSICIRLLPNMIPHQLTRLIPAYFHAYGVDSAWHEHLTARSVASHLGSLIRDFSADFVALESRPDFAVGVKLQKGNRILFGLSPFGAMEGDYLLSEWAATSEEAAELTLQELISIGKAEGASVMWARTCEEARDEQRRLESAGFERVGEYYPNRKHRLVYRRAI